jgi:crotonobetainyl-CoA:carnitine CoA-transferase CaiB-like acyl-CoA transferase
VATLHLADMGADVIKVENREEGDYARSLSRVLFRLVNRNKRAIRLDLKRREGREVFLRLAKDADALVEGFRPGVMAKLGLDYGELAAVNPRIVYCSITGYGQDGPYAGRAGHDINYVGYAGVADQIGTSEAPVVPNFQIADLLGGALVPAMGILAALVEARSSGRGRHVDVAMTDAVLAHAILPLAGYLKHGKAPERGTGMLGGGLPCYSLYRTRDGRFMAVGALERKFWEALCDILGCPQLKGKHIVHGDEANAVRGSIAAIFAARTQSEWTQVFATADCCVSPVLTIEESLADEHLRTRGMFVMEQGTTQFAPPLKFSEFEFQILRAAPEPGEHTDEILGAAGYDRTRIDALRNSGVI